MTIANIQFLRLLNFYLPLAKESCDQIHDRHYLLTKIEFVSGCHLPEHLRCKPTEWLESLYRLVAADYVSVTETGINLKRERIIDVKSCDDLVMILCDAF